MFLRRVTAEGAGGFEAVVIAEDTAGGLHHVLGFLCLGVIQVIVDLLEHQQAQGQQHHHGHDQDEPQAAADRHIAQAVHNPFTPFSCSCSKPAPASNHTLPDGPMRPVSNNAAAFIGLV
ncbi:hypothetical protein D3C80_1270360 [compost metagenome]